MKLIKGIKVKQMTKNLESFQSITPLQELENIYQTKIISTIKVEEWNQEYEAMEFELFQYRIKSRLGKKTPKKKGYFVTLWEKDKNNQNIPIDLDKMSDYLIIHIIDQELNGMFVFDKKTLLTKGILSDINHKGKMAFRVYPTWETGLNTSANKTQQWQKSHFIDLSQTSLKQQKPKLDSLLNHEIN